MIISNIIGGLGNQMFQYACGRAVASRTGQPLRLAADQFPLYHMHTGFELARTFRLDAFEAGPKELRALLGWQAAPAIRKVLGRPAAAVLHKRAWALEPGPVFWPGIERVSGPAYLHGYWQSERYFTGIAPALRKAFDFALDWDAQDAAVRDRMAAGPSVSVHVRRGDYTTAKNQGIYAACSLDYYRTALRHVRERAPEARIFLFSDDPDWAAANLAPEFGALELVRHNAGARSPRDMRLMSLATHHVIANSSFSWWGAWLDPSPDKIVVAPKAWYVDESTRSSADLIPSEWVRL